jgi:hypothetical protein
MKASDYVLTPNQIDDMTLGQIWLYFAEDAERITGEDVRQSVAEFWERRAAELGVSVEEAKRLRAEEIARGE